MAAARDRKLISALAAVVAMVAAARELHAETTRAIDVTGSDAACPRPGEVVRLLQQMLPSTEIGRGGREGATVADITDDGPRYRVTVGHAMRELGDPARHCDERAKAVAVFVALAVAPLLVEERHAEPPPSPPAARPPPAPASAIAPRRIEVDVDVDFIADGYRGGVAFGGGVRVGFVSGFVGASLGVAGASPAALDLSGTSGQLARVPVDLAVRARYRYGRFELVGDVGFAAIVLLASTDATTPPSRGSGVDLGLRIGLAARVWLTHRIALHTGLQAIVVPSPTAVVVSTDARDVASGMTPLSWIGGMLGITARAR